jgi:hypothetical protein
LQIVQTGEASSGPLVSSVKAHPYYSLWFLHFIWLGTCSLRYLCPRFQLQHIAQHMHSSVISPPTRQPCNNQIDTQVWACKAL